MNKIDSYLKEVYIQEDMQAALKDYSNINKPLMMKIKSGINPKDPKGSLKKIASFAPSGFNSKKAMKKIDEALGMKISQYPKLKKRATIVVKNSITGVSAQMAEAAGTFLAFASLFAKKGQEGIAPEKNLQQNLKTFVVKVRKFGAEYEDDEEKKEKRMRPSDYADLSVAWVIVVMSTALAIGIGAGTYVALKVVSLAIAATLPWIMKTATIMILGMIALMVALWFKGMLGV